MKWLIDPITRQPSVALTLVVLATGLMVVGIVLECFTTLRSSHLLDELFGAAMALYGGHMVTFRNSSGPGDGLGVGEFAPGPPVQESRLPSSAFQREESRLPKEKITE